MIPGSAIGSISSSEIASRPKKRERQTAAAASVPSTMATAVETAPTCSDSASACADIFAARRLRANHG